jgi:hypothetical protein
VVVVVGLWEKFLNFVPSSSIGGSIQINVTDMYIDDDYIDDDYF